MGVLVSLAGGQSDGRLADATTIAVIWPLTALIFLSIAVLVLRFNLRLSTTAVLSGLHSLMPLIAIAFAGLTLLVGTTALPLMLFLVSLGIGWIVWRETKHRVKAVLAGGVTLLGYLLALAVPSLIGRAGLPAGTPDVFIGSLGGPRGLILLATNSYWWKNIYERFPFSSGGEAEAGVTLLLGALAFVVMAGCAFVLAKGVLRLSWRSALLYVRGRIFVFHLALVAFGASLAVLQGAKLAWHPMDVLAWLVLLMSVGAAWLFVIGRNDAADLRWDETFAPDKPLITGMVREQDVREASALFLAIALVGGWLLGWPVFAALLAWVVAYEAYHSPPFRLKGETFWKNLLLGIAGLFSVLMGYLFAAETSSLHDVSPRFWFGLLAMLTLLSIQKEVRGDTSPPRLRWIAGLVALGYVLPPIVVGSWKWLGLAVPVAGLSAFVILTKPHRSSRFYGLFYLFLAVSFFLLSSS